MTRRLNALVLVQLVALAAILSTAAVHAETGYGGTIHYRDGTSVQFEWFGNTDTVQPATLSGQIGARNIQLDFHEVREIIFTEPSKSYAGTAGAAGQMIIVNHDGERFNARGGVYVGGHWGVLRYVYQDPITRVLRATSDSIGETIASVTIGEHVGNMKRNPETGEFFPPTFVYDPYTGHRLEWATP